MTPEPYEIRIKAYDNLSKEVGRASERNGLVYLPKEWIGKKVQVILTESIEPTQ